MTTNTLVNAVGTFNKKKDLALASLSVNGQTKATAKSNLPLESPHLPHLDIHPPFLRPRKTRKANRSSNLQLAIIWSCCKNWWGTFNFIVDTILPTKFSGGLCLNPPAVHLSYTGGQRIPCHDEAQVEIKIRQLRRAFKWNLVIADFINQLLGKYLLSNYGLLVDYTNDWLRDTSTNKTIKTGRTNCFVEQICIDNVLQLLHSMKNLLHEYPLLTAPRSNNFTSPNSRLKHTIIGFTLIYNNGRDTKQRYIIYMKMVDVGKLISLGNLLVRKVTWFVLTTTSAPLLLSRTFGVDHITRISYIYSRLPRTHSLTFWLKETAQTLYLSHFDLQRKHSLSLPLPLFLSLSLSLSLHSSFLPCQFVRHNNTRSMCAYAFCDRFLSCSAFSVRLVLAPNTASEILSNPESDKQSTWEKTRSS